MEAKGFHKALLMFSRMFANPLFDKNLMSKEINAVNSENEKNINQDSWRQNELLKLLSDPDHPYHHFSTGNKITLDSLSQEELLKRLHNFYNKYYLPTSMKLSIISKVLLLKFTR